MSANVGSSSSGQETNGAEDQPASNSEATTNTQNISTSRINNNSNAAATSSEPQSTNSGITASALDPFISNVTLRQNNSSATNTSLKHITDYLRKTDDLLYNNLTRVDQVLTLLNTNDNSIAIAQVLWAKLSSLPLDADLLNTVEPLIVQTVSFLKEANYSDFEVQGLDLFSRMVKVFGNVLVSRERAQIGLQPIRNVIKIMRREGEFISVLTTFLYLCLRSNNFRPAFEILDSDIVEIRHEGPKSDFVDIILYFYYGGVCYLAAKNYSRANLFFEIAVSTPATAVSKIMVEAYKKYLLTSFILHGKLKGSPVKSSPSSNIFLRSVKSSTQVYSDLLDCKIVADLNESLSRNETAFREDGNYGLVKLCIVSMYKRNIQKLTKTFITLSLADITSTVKLENTSQTEKFITEMVNEGQIQAKVNHEQDMVYFSDNSEQRNGEEALLKLTEQISKCVEINAKFRELDDAIKTSAQYQEKLQRTSSAGEANTWDFSAMT